jgi:hypothetical protein
MVQFLRAYLGWQLPMDRPARRFDFGFGRVHYLKYFLAQVELYRPSWRHVGTSGTSSIAEVPPTACLFPINMATYIARLGYDSTVFSDLASMPLDSATPVVLRAPVLQEHYTHTEEGSR